MQVCRRGELGKEAINTVFGEHRGAEGGRSERAGLAGGAGREKEAAARGKGCVQSQGAGKPGAGNMSGGEPTVKCAESSARLTRSPRAGR